MEGFVNRYILNDSLSTADSLVFETEVIENFAGGGSAKWTIKKGRGEKAQNRLFCEFPRQRRSMFWPKCVGAEITKH